MHVYFCKPSTTQIFIFLLIELDFLLIDHRIFFISSQTDSLYTKKQFILQTNK